MNERSGYSAISSVPYAVGVGGSPSPSQQHSPLVSHGRQQKRNRNIIILVSFAVAVATILVVALASMGTSRGIQNQDSLSAQQHPLPMPHGVNLGSWLSLEDYFYVGRDGAEEVATADDVVAAKCLPPLAIPARWNSETDLLANLTATVGLRKAIEAFHAFRISYLDYHEELPRIARLGIQHVRVPVSWCLTDHDPTLMLRRVHEDGRGGGYPDDAELEEKFTCRDPFFAKQGIAVRWPAVPRSLLEDFLHACGHHGIKATLDIHTYPGGTSIGTFSGVWPLKPLFWKYDYPEHPQVDVGRGVLREWLAWIESLSTDNPEAFAGLGAISPMNEPAHLAGMFGPGSANPQNVSYLPSLPDTVAGDYLSELDGRDDATAIPDGPHLRVLYWLNDAVKSFRASSLPQLGIQLQVNIIESIFVASLVPDDVDGAVSEATAIIAKWWGRTTTSAERTTWAVLDVHHYHAWAPSCQGTVDGSGNYTCGDSIGTDLALSRCTSWAGMYRSTMDKHLGKGARLLSAEFSASTHHSVRRSCLDATTLRKSYLAQVKASKHAHVHLFWWSWKMPHGGAFRPAWSFKHFLYLLGVPGFYRPDESELECLS